jgi:hypothetical protein
MKEHCLDLSEDRNKQQALAQSSIKIGSIPSVSEELLAHPILFLFWTMRFLKVNEKPTNSLIIQCISTQYSPTCFGTLKFHHQALKYDPASHDIGHLSQQDHVLLPDGGILNCRNM